MIPLAYNVSERLAKTLEVSESLNKKLLLYPLAPKVELRLTWEANISRIYWSLVLSANPLSRTQMAKTISGIHKLKKFSAHQKEVINYKQALSYINTEWLVSTKPVTINTLNNLFNLACKGIFPQSVNQTNKHKEALTSLLDFLNKSEEHPIIQAAIAQVQLVSIAPFSQGNGRVARLIAYLFLYRGARNYRNLLVFDEYLRKDVVTLKHAIDMSIKRKNLTTWIEYFAQGIASQLEKAYEGVVNTKFITDTSSSYWKLNERQRYVLDILDNPSNKVSNKDLQAKFKVSQITASRDLTKLVSMDLLFTHGKGRSTFYTKV